MRYLSSISLALIVLMALACTAEPTPNIDATVEAKVARERAIEATIEARVKNEETVRRNICDSIRLSLAMGQSAQMAHALTLQWENEGCAPNVGPGTLGSVTAKRPSPTATPDIWANARLYYTWKDLLTSYKTTPEGKRHADCLRQINVNSNTSTITARYHQGPFQGLFGDSWIIEVTGNACRAIETWHIDDETGEVTYGGSSLDK